MSFTWIWPLEELGTSGGLEAAVTVEEEAERGGAFARERWSEDCGGCCMLNSGGCIES